MRRPVLEILQSLRRSEPKRLNVILYPKSVFEELKAQNEALDNLLTALQCTRTFIGGYIADGRLTGAAFSAHKRYFEEGHLPFLVEFRNAIVDQRVENVRHLTHLHALNFNYYNRAKLVSEIDRLNARITYLEGRLWSFNILQLRWHRCDPTYALIAVHTRCRDTFKRMLEELDTYLQNTNHLHSNMDSTLQRVRFHLMRIQKQQKCPDTGVITLPTLQEAVKSLVLNADGTIDMSALAALVQNPDGSIDWNLLREFDWDTVKLAIEAIKGPDVLELLLDRVAVAEEYLEMWGFPSPPNDPMLLLQKFQDHLIMEAIDYIRNNDPRFCEEVWANATIEERINILNIYMNEIMPIFGVQIIDEIYLIEPRNPEYPHRPRGNYSHSGRRDEESGELLRDPRTVGINPWWLDSTNVGCDDSLRLFNTIAHELRHAYQRYALANPGDFIVSEATLEAWRNNYQNVIFPGERRFTGNDTGNEAGNKTGDGKFRYTWEEYRNQAIEVDAFGIGNGTGWEKV